MLIFAATPGPGRPTAVLRQVHLLLLLLGPPCTLNVRNLVWHGFVAPQQLPRRLLALLLLLAASVGALLAGCVPPARRQVTYSEVSAA